MSLMFVHEAERNFEHDDLRWPLGIDPFHDEVETYISLNRQSERFRCEGIDLSLSTLADQVGVGSSPDCRCIA
jgi:hypothetical protein